MEEDNKDIEAEEPEKEPVRFGWVTGVMVKPMNEMNYIYFQWNIVCMGYIKTQRVLNGGYLTSAWFCIMDVRLP